MKRFDPSLLLPCIFSGEKFGFGLRIVSVPQEQRLDKPPR